MDDSKPWDTTIALGQRILEELKLDREMDTLGRWLAHHLAEQMQRAVAAPEGAGGEPDRRECVDLILRLWERRQTWPLSAPLKDVAGRLDELLRPKPRFLHSSTGKSDPYLDLLHNLEELHHREAQICLAVWISGLDLSAEREYLDSHPEHLDENELRIIRYLVETQNLISGPKARLDGEPCPDFVALPKSEQSKIARARLRAIAKSRTQLFGR